MAPMNARLLRPRASGATHPEARDWATRATANGGTVDTASLAAADAFCRAIDAGGIRGKLSYVNLLIGGNLEAALVPLYRSFSFGGTTYGDATATNNNFTSDNYTLAGGLNVASAQRNLNLGTTLSWATSVFDLHMGAGMSQAGSAGQFSLVLHGAFDTNNRTFIDVNNNVYRGNLGGNSPSTVAGINGRFITSRLSQTSNRSYRDGSGGTLNTNSVSDVNRSDRYTYVGSTNLSNGHSILYFHLGSGLTDGEVSILDAALATFLTIIGRS